MRGALGISFDRQAFVIVFVCRIIKLLVGPITPVLRVGDMNNRANIFCLGPHGPAHMTMKFTHTIGYARKPQGPKEWLNWSSVIPVNFLTSSTVSPLNNSFSDRGRYRASHCLLLRGMRCEYETLFDICNVSEFLLEVEYRRNAMRFVKMVYFRIISQFIQQFRATNSKQDELSNFCSHIGIVKAMRDGL